MTPRSRLCAISVGLAAIGMAAACGRDVIDHSSACTPYWDFTARGCALVRVCSSTHLLVCNGTSCSCQAWNGSLDLAAGDSSWGDYTVSMSVRTPTNTVGSWGVTVRRQDAGDDYELVLYSDKWYFNTNVGGNQQGGDWSSFSGYGPAEWHDLTISVATVASGTVMDAYWDGSRLLPAGGGSDTFIDTSGTYGSGGISLRTQVDPIFESVRVIRGAAAAPDGGAATVLFADDFSSDPLGKAPAGWMVAGGTWIVVADGSTHGVQQTGQADIVRSFSQADTCSSASALMSAFLGICQF